MDFRRTMKWLVFLIMLFLGFAPVRTIAQSIGGACSTAGSLSVGAGSSHPGYTLYCNGSTWALAEAITSGGLVGIGTATPSAELHVLSGGGVGSPTPSFGSSDLVVIQNNAAEYSSVNLDLVSDFFGSSTLNFDAYGTGYSGNANIEYVAQYGQLRFNFAGATAMEFAVSGVNFGLAIGAGGAGGSEMLAISPQNGSESNDYFSISSSSDGDTFMVKKSGNVGIGSSSPAVSLDLSPKTDAISLPSGTTAQEPSGVNGMIRYNSSVPKVEAYYDSTWNGLMTVCHAKYSFAVDGGAISTITPATNCTIPANAIFVAATIDVTTAVTSAGAPTIAIGTNATGGSTSTFHAAALKAVYVAGLLNGATTFAAPVKVTSSGSVTVTIATATLTAGVIEIWIQYYVAAA